MVDKIDILINIFGSEENVEMLDATKRVTEGMHTTTDYLSYSSYIVKEGIHSNKEYSIQIP